LTIRRENQDGKRLMLGAERLDERYARAGKLYILNVEELAQLREEAQHALHRRRVIAIERPNAGIHEPGAKQIELVFHGSLSPSCVQASTVSAPGPGARGERRARSPSHRRRGRRRAIAARSRCAPGDAKAAPGN